MRRLVLWILPLALAPALLADEPPKQEAKSNKQATPAEQFKALEADVEKAKEELIKAYTEAKTSEEKEKVKADAKKLPEKFGPRFLALAEKNPKEEFAFQALAFVLSSPEPSPVTGKAIDFILKDRSKDPKTLELAQALAENERPLAEPLLRGLLARSSDHAVQAQASLGLANLFKSKAESGDVQPAETEKRYQEAEALLTDIAHKYPDAKEVGKQAEDVLFEIRHLGLGKKPPEITGEDGDGKKFKLSEYQGKVVVLDFWANW